MFVKRKVLHVDGKTTVTAKGLIKDGVFTGEYRYDNFDWGIEMPLAFTTGKKVIIVDNIARHEFEIGEIVTLVHKEDSGLWKAYSEKKGNWWIDELDGNVIW